MKPAIGFAVAKKKTAFQKHKEAEEERKRKAEEEAAKVYEEFVESFQGDAPPEQPPARRSRSEGPKPFIRGGVAIPGQSYDEPAPPSSSKGTAYRPGSGFDKPKPKAFDDDEEPEEVPQPKKVEKDKPRQIDLMLEKLKQEQQERDEREAARREGKAGLNYEAAPSFEELGMNPGSFDSGDPSTTNLYLGNLAPDVDEPILIKEFGRFGAIGSVKVMWPRDEEQRRKGRNCGFVAFMRRDDAAKAMDAMDGIILHDFELRIGWGKAVNLPAVPVWAGPNTGMSLASAASHAKSGYAASVLGAAVPPPPALAAAGATAAMPWSTGVERRDTTRGLHDGVGPDIEVPIIEDLRQRFIIDSLALYVQQDGCAFEQLVMEEEQGNPEYSFLFDLNSPEHIYYRWRVYSLAEGNTLRTWRIEPFVMVEGGQRWVAPSMTAMALSAGTAAAKGVPAIDRPHQGHERPLSDKERDRFEDMLRNLTVERADIRGAMVFVLDCADAGAEVVDTLAEALTLPETPIPLKIARLFLVSDILHNSTAPVRNASRYRGRFEAVLPAIFESLQETYRSVETRITQEALRRHVLRVLRCWREHYVFGDDYLNGLQATFLQPLTDLASLTAANPDLAAQLAALSPEELERKCRLSGLSVKGGREAQTHRLLALDTYINNPGGAKLLPVAQPVNTPMFASGATQGDAAGEQAAGGEVKQEGEAKPAPIVSRWTSIDESQEKATIPAMPISKWLAQEAEQERQRRQAAAAAAAAAADQAIFTDTDSGDEGKGGAGATPGGAAGSGQGAGAAGWAPASAAPTTEMDPKRREKLREVELACARLEAELEESGLSRAEVEARVSARRAELKAEIERGDAPVPAPAPVPGPSHAPAPGRDNQADRDARPGEASRAGERDRRRSRSREGDRRDPPGSSSDRRRSRSRSRDRIKSRSSAHKDDSRERDNRDGASHGTSSHTSRENREHRDSRDRERDSRPDSGRDRDRDRDRRDSRQDSRSNAKRSRSRSRSRDRKRR